MPGLNGFVGEYLILIGSFQTARWWTVVATVGVILAALYLLWAYQRVFHGEPDEDNSTFPELKLKEGLVLLPFLAAIVFIGVYPKPLLDRIEPSVDASSCTSPTTPPSMRRRSAASSRRSPTATDEARTWRRSATATMYQAMTTTATSQPVTARKVGRMIASARRRCAQSDDFVGPEVELVRTVADADAARRCARA